jgi:hypothetical protein
VLDGMASVAGFYRETADAGLTVFGPLEEQVMVSERSYAAESTFAQIVPGHV